MGNAWLRLLGAVQFLTVIPISRPTVPVSESAAFFPLVGAAIGLISALPIAYLPLPAGLTAAIALMLQLAITGMLHEDGLADIADGVRKGRTVEQMLDIVKDSRVGSYGAAALCIALLLRWQGLEAVAARAGSPYFALLWVAAAEALSRYALLWFGWISTAARPGMGAYLSEGRSGGAILLATLQAVALLFALDVQAALAILLGTVVIIVGARQYFTARLGGVVGDCFGALQQAVVIYCLIVVAWPRS